MPTVTKSTVVILYHQALLLSRGAENRNCTVGQLKTKGCRRENLGFSSHVSVFLRILSGFLFFFQFFLLLFNYSMHPNVHSSTIYNSQVLEGSYQVSSSRTVKGIQVAQPQLSPSLKEAMKLSCACSSPHGYRINHALNML